MGLTRLGYKLLGLLCGLFKESIQEVGKDQKWKGKELSRVKTAMSIKVKERVLLGFICGLGFWKNSMLSGEGERETADGEIYKGLWMNGQLNGLGVIITHIGRYEGEIVNSVESGYGTMVRKIIYDILIAC